MADVFRLALSGTEKVVHSSSTTLYGALDNDDMFMYMGGLAAAIRGIDGKSPELVVTNTRNPGKPEMTTMDKFIGTEFRSRYVNPTWIEGMKKEGYAGAGAMREFVEYMWGWDATVPELVDDAMWKETFDVYVQDRHNLGMKQFFDSKSPFAYQDMTARMVETVRKGYWKADADTQKKLLEEYVESVNKYGASGAETTSGNARLQKYVMEQGKLAGIPVPALENFSKVMEQSAGRSVVAAAKDAEAFAKKNDAREAAASAQVNAQMKPGPNPPNASAQQAPTPTQQPQSAAAKLQGFLMEQQKQAQEALAKAARPRNSQWDGLYVALPILAILIAWYVRRRRLHV
jgi:cobaltochelatase CobN